MPRVDNAGSELIEVIGEDGLFMLADRFAGTRLYIPKQLGSGHEIVSLLGNEKAQALSSHFSPDVIKVPLARELRATRYRKMGMSNAQVAVQLGLTESGVEKLFLRLRHKIVDNCPRQSFGADHHG